MFLASFPIGIVPLNTAGLSNSLSIMFHTHSSTIPPFSVYAHVFLTGYAGVCCKE